MSAPVHPSNTSHEWAIHVCNPEQLLVFRAPTCEQSSPNAKKERKEKTKQKRGQQTDIATTRPSSILPLSQKLSKNHHKFANLQMCFSCLVSARGKNQGKKAAILSNAQTRGTLHSRAHRPGQFCNTVVNCAIVLHYYVHIRELCNCAALLCAH